MLGNSSLESEISRAYNNLSSEIESSVKKYAQGSLNKSLLVNEINTKQYINIQNLFDSIEQYDLLVGVPSESAYRKSGKINNAELVFIHTHGVDKKEVRNNITILRRDGMNFKGARKAAQALYIAKHGSPVSPYRIPPRPIIEPAIEANSESINKKITSALSSFLNFDFVEGEKKLKTAGMFAQNKVRAWFTDERNNWPPNAPYTIEKKSKNGKIKDNPLIDTGELRKSITYVVKTPDSRFVRKIKRSNILGKTSFKQLFYDELKKLF